MQGFQARSVTLEGELCAECQHANDSFSGCILHCKCILHLCNAYGISALRLTLVQQQILGRMQPGETKRCLLVSATNNSLIHGCRQASGEVWISHVLASLTATRIIQCLSPMTGSAGYL
jgi:hypothetical protein